MPPIERASDQWPEPSESPDAKRKYRDNLHHAIYGFGIDEAPAKDPEVLQAMMRSGGGFVSALALAWMHADATNNAKLFRNFGHYYAEYQSILRDEQDRRNAKGRDTP